MDINKIEIKVGGYVACKSSFYSAITSINSTLVLTRGINRFECEIDAEYWAISYLLSMYDDNDDFILDENPIIIVDGKDINIKDILKYTCYMDKINPEFSSNETVETLVAKGIKQYNLSYTTEDIRDMFYMEDFRFKRPLSGVGNEVFKAMGAIGFVNQKEIFCMPWLSRKRFDGFHLHLIGAINILEKLGKTIIVPIGRQ